VCRGRVEVVVQLLAVLAVVALVAGNAEHALLEDRVLGVPERDGEAEVLVVVGDAREAVLAPAIGARTGVLVREMGPCIAVTRVVLTDRRLTDGKKSMISTSTEMAEIEATYPLTLTNVRTPSLPVPLAILVLLQPELLDTNVAVAEAVDQPLAVAATVRRVRFGRGLLGRRVGLSGLGRCGSLRVRHHRRRLGDPDFERWVLGTRGRGSVGSSGRCRGAILASK
jgi:hypothetical protein